MAIVYKGRRRKFVEREHPRNPHTGEFVEKTGAHASWLMRIANRTQGPNLGGGFVKSGGTLRPTGGKTSVASLKGGEHAKVAGVDQYGRPISFTGYVQGKPGPVTVRQRGKRTSMLAVSMAETPSGGGASWRGTVYVKPDAQIERTRPKADVARLEGGGNTKERDVADVTAMTPEQLDDELARLGGELDRMGGNARGSAAWNNTQGRLMLVRQEKARRVDDAQRARDTSTVQARISADIARQRGETGSLADEMKRVVEHTQRYTPKQRATSVAAQKFYTHPDIPSKGFSSRSEAAEAALRRRRDVVDTPRVKQDTGGMAPTTLATQPVKLHEVRVGDRMQYGVEKDRVTPKYHTVTEASSDERFTRIKLSDGTVFSMARVADIDIVKRSGSAPAPAPTPAAPTAPAAKPITGMIKDAASRIANDYPAATRETPHWSGTPQMSTVNALHAVADRFERGAINKSEAMSALNRLSINLARSPEGGEVAKLAKAVKKAPARAPKTGLSLPDLRDESGKPPAASKVANAVNVLKSTKSRDEARAALDGMTVAQLQQVAAEMGRSKLTGRKADMASQLVHSTVGARVNFGVLRGDPEYGTPWQDSGFSKRFERTDASVNDVAAKATFTPVRDAGPPATAYASITKRATLLSMLRQRGLKAKRGAPDDDLRKLLADDDLQGKEGRSKPLASSAPKTHMVWQPPGEAPVVGTVIRQNSTSYYVQWSGPGTTDRVERIPKREAGNRDRYLTLMSDAEFDAAARDEGLVGDAVHDLADKPVSPRESVADAQTVESLAAMKRPALLAVRRNTPGARNLRRGASEREIAEEIVRARNANMAADRADTQAIMTADLGKAPAAPNTVQAHSIGYEHIGATVRFTVPDRFGRTDKDKTYEGVLLEIRAIDGQQRAARIAGSQGSVWMPSDTPIEVVSPRPDTPEFQRYAKAVEDYDRAQNRAIGAKYAHTSPTMSSEEVTARGEASEAESRRRAAEQALLATLTPSAPARTSISDNDLAGDIPAAVNRLAAMTPTDAKKLLETQRIGTLADLARQLKVRVEPTPKSLIKNIQSGLKVERLERMQQRTPTAPAPSTPAGMSPLRLDSQIDAAERLITQTRDALEVEEARGGMMGDREIGLRAQLRASERKLTELRAEKAKRVGASPVAVPEAPAGPDTLPPALPWRPRDMSTIEARRNAVRDATMFRTDFDALPEDRRQAILTELRQVVASGDTQTIPSNRTSMGTTIRGAEAPHVAKARGLLNNFLAVRAAAPDNTIRGRAARLREGDRYALEGATIAELGEIAEVAGFRRPGPSWKRDKAVEYLRNRAIIGDKMPTSYRPIQMAETMRGVDKGQALALLDYVEADFGITKTDMKEIARELGVTLRNGDKRAMMHALSAAAKDAPGKA